MHLWLINAFPKRRRKVKLFRRRSLIVCVISGILLFVIGKLFVVPAETNNVKLFTVIANRVELPMNMREYSQNVKTKAHEFPVFLKHPTRLVNDVNCDAIIKGNRTEIEKAKLLLNSSNFTRKGITDGEYIELTKDCDSFKSKRYAPYYLSVEEIGFSVAYSILLYKEVEQAERLLRAIYSPQNYYCLHVDADAKQEVHDAINSIANCFDNVFVVSRKEYVVYAGFTRLQADLTCMENLLLRSKNWKYFINLPSQQFPLKTNAEIVEILKIYNGSNDIEGVTGKRTLKYRYENRYVYRHLHDQVKPKLIRTNQTKDDPPFNITVVKGSAYGIFSREFAYFVTYNRTARELLDWFRDVFSPDEFYWATLNYNHHIGAPGSFYKGKPDDNPWLSVFVRWRWGGPCEGKFVRSVCVFGVGDLHLLTTKPHLFANKFYIDYEPYALDCMEEWHFNRTTRGTKDLNVTYYQSLPFINRGN